MSWSILTYHSIDNGGSVLSVSPGLFQKQMYFLWSAGFHVVPLSQLKRLISERKPSSRKVVAITFDDGFRNVFTKAVPILRRYNFPATVFLIANYCGKFNDWPGNPPLSAREPLVSWSEVAEMQKSGIEFGSHTLHHPDLTLLPPAAAEREIVHSKNKIEDHVGARVTTFAYPYGKFNGAVRNLVESNFELACSTVLGQVEADSDLLALKRIDTYYLTHPLHYRGLATRRLAAYLRVRQLLRTFKARAMTKA